VPALTAEFTQLRVGDAFVLNAAPPWQPMPVSHIEGYSAGRLPGTYTDTTFYESNGNGSITFSYMRAPLGDHLALLSSYPEFPYVDSAGLVYIASHGHRFDFSQGPQQVVDTLKRRHEELAKRESQMEHYPLQSEFRLGDMIGFTSTTEFPGHHGDRWVEPSVTNCTVHVVDPGHTRVWCFILLSRTANLESALGRFLAMLHSADFGG